MKPLCIYHHNCADGFCAAWVFKNYADREHDFHPGIYQQEPPDVTGRDVYLVDFSYKRPVVEKMLETAKRVVLIDHHKTAIEDLQPLIDAGRIEALTSLEHSGAMLAWKWFHGNFSEPPALIKHIEDRDLWRFKLPKTREIQANVFSHPYEFDAWDKLMQADPQELAKEGEAIERKHFKDVAELLKVTTRRMVLGGYNVPIANLPYTLVSDAAHALAENEPFAGCYWDTPKGRVFGLRSHENGIDVSDIAKQYGGGGHPHAAGFTVSYDIARQHDPLSRRAGREVSVLKPKEAADRLDVSVRTLQRLVHAGQIPVIQVSPRIRRFSPTAIDQYLQRREKWESGPTKTTRDEPATASRSRGTDDDWLMSAYRPAHPRRRQNTTTPKSQETGSTGAVLAFRKSP